MGPTAEVAPPELPGLIFVRRLGTGGYAEVFLYEQTNTHMRVAVKVLFKENLSDRMREQFAAEANTMAELADHPNIVQVFGADVTADGRPYLVMKYYPQRNLYARARAERLPVPEVLQIGVRISCAVETAHRAGILHRDIKPANILTSQYGEPGLTDFGIATRSAGDSDEESQGLSVPWSAPEVVFATSPGDRTADVYSLGATLWHLLAGHSPFEVPGGDNSTPALMRRIREKPVSKTGRDDVPPSLERLLAQAMAKSPADRPQTALQLARSLQAIEAEERWAPTPLVLLEERLAYAEDAEAAPETDDRTASRDGATRRRQSAVVVQPIEEPVAPDSDRATVRRVTIPNASSVASTSPAERVRQGMPAAVEGPATVRRSSVAAPPATLESAPGPATEVGVPRTQRFTWKLVAASVVIVGAAVGVAVALTSSGGRAASSTTTSVTDTAPTLALTSPGTPTITGSRIDASHVKFTWTLGDPKPGDRFYWKEPGGTMNTTTANSVTVAAPSPQQACITVEVVRGSAYADSSLTCAG